MIFSSPLFLFAFLPIALLGYYLIRKDFRNIYLFFISITFYAWAGLKLVLILLACFLLNYLCGLLVEFVKTKPRLINRAVVIISVTINLLLIGYFKYYNFFVGSIDRVSGLQIPLKEIILPLGISFYVFSGIAYILDVNSGKINAEKNPLNFALFLSFFPKLLQGPISRYPDVSSQIRTREESLEKFSTGAYRFVVGLAKKAIIADQLGIIVDQIFSFPATNGTFSVAWLGAISYSMQIYFDFSGYTDMAIGLGKMFGFELVENFNFPYISTSVAEFWRRWHISLSTWFRDYVFLPLEFKRRKTKILRQETNTLIVFFLTGLWHGAGMRFVLWGLWHGFMIVVERIFNLPKSRVRLPLFFKWLITMGALILGWVLFRSPDVKYALEYMGVMFGIVKSVNNGANLFWYLNLKTTTIFVLGLLACVPWKDVFPKLVVRYNRTTLGTIAQNAVFVILLLGSLIFVVSSSYKSFIYFQF